VIVAVEEGSAADQAGLTPSMAIVQVGRRPVRGVPDFEEAVRSASRDRGLLLLVRSAQGSRFVVVQPQ
jgi:serine protease Do